MSVKTVSAEFAKRMVSVSRVSMLSIIMLGAACTGNSQVVDARNEAPLEPGRSLMGNYLAALHAQSEGNMEAAGLYYGATLDFDPGNADLIRRTFLVNLLDDNMAGAIKLAPLVLDRNPDDQLANLTLVADFFIKGQFEEARTRLDALKDGGLNNYLKPLFRAWSYIGDGGDSADGKAAFAALAPLAESPATTLLHNAHAALINVAIGDNEQAETLFVGMIETQGGMSLRKTRLFGAFYEKIGEFEKAGALYNGYIDQYGSAQFLQKALERVESKSGSTLATMNASQGAAEALFDLTGSLRQQNAMETALVLSHIGLHMRPDFSTLKLIAGGILEGIERYDSAQKIYEKISPSSDYNWDARLRITTILDDQGQSEEAIEILRQMAEEKPNAPSPMIDIGDIMRRLDRFDEAVEAYDAAFARLENVTEGYWSLYYALGIALERVDNWPRAEESFKKALELRPDQPYVLNYLAYSWVEKGLHLDEASEMLRNAREQRPNDAYIIDSVGWVHYQLGAYDNAVIDLEEAVELLPQDPIVNDHLGDAYWQVGRKREARFQWNRSLSLDPEPDTISIIENKIKFGLEVPQAKTTGEDGNG